MTEKDQADLAQSRQAVFVRCCLIFIFVAEGVRGCGLPGADVAKGNSTDRRGSGDRDRKAPEGEAVGSALGVSPQGISVKETD